MISRVLIGDNNLSRFWPAYQFSRPSLKTSTLITATDLDTLDQALTQVDDKEQVLISILTSVLLEEVNQQEIASSAYNVCDQTISRLLGLCPQSPSCQVRSLFCCFAKFYQFREKAITFSCIYRFNQV